MCAVYILRVFLLYYVLYVMKNLMIVFGFIRPSQRALAIIGTNALLLHQWTMNV